jgi:hypothetical protein
VANASSARTGEASALDASARLIAELAESMSGQAQRALRQIGAADAVELSPRAVEALGRDAAELERQCRGIRERLGLDELPATVPAPPRRSRRTSPDRGTSPADAARTLALELRALGIERDEVAKRLVDTFEVDDPKSIVDSAFTER